MGNARNNARKWQKKKKGNFGGKIDNSIQKTNPKNDSNPKFRGFGGKTPGIENNPWKQLEFGAAAPKRGQILGPDKEKGDFYQPRQ